ncbi:MAG: hypothetical protein ACK559_31540, partial [bacterium]
MPELAGAVAQVEPGLAGHDHVIHVRARPGHAGPGRQPPVDEGQRGAAALRDAAQPRVGLEQGLGRAFAEQRGEEGEGPQAEVGEAGLRPADLAQAHLGEAGQLHRRAPDPRLRPLQDGRGPAGEAGVLLQNLVAVRVPEHHPAAGRLHRGEAQPQAQG